MIRIYESYIILNFEIKKIKLPYYSISNYSKQRFPLQWMALVWAYKMWKVLHVVYVTFIFRIQNTSSIFILQVIFDVIGLNIDLCYMLDCPSVRSFVCPSVSLFVYLGLGPSNLVSLCFLGERLIAKHDYLIVTSFWNYMAINIQ